MHRRALALQPDFAYVHNDLGNALAEAGGSRSDEVLYHYERAAELAPTMAEAHSNVGTALKENARHAEAAARYELAISIKPTLCEAYKNLGSSYTETARLPEALVAFRGALRVNPQFWPALYALLDGMQFLAEWRGRERLLAQLGDHLADWHVRRSLGAGPDERMHGGLAPFNTLVWPVSLSTQLAVAQNRAGKDVVLAAASPLRPPLRWQGCVVRGGGGGGGGSGGCGRGGRGGGDIGVDTLRLGFISADFGDHPVGHALLPWLQALARNTRLTILCFATDSGERRHAGTKLRRQIAEASDIFYDLSDVNDAEAARVINGQRVHLLINLIGHTAGARHVLTQYQPAPLQALHYGYPSTSALPAMHYMQLDAAAAPPTHRADFSERYALFPHSHFVPVHAERYPHVPRATRRAHPWHASTARGRLVDASDGGAPASRADLGLELSARRLAEGFALCNFNQLYKLDPSSLDVWANAIMRLPRSFLWLTRVSVRKDSSRIAEMNIRAEVASRGLGLGRVAFGWKFPERDYVPFRALADLAVDNRLYNAHTTGADTLWAGVPTVAFEARHLAGRASASFARALGLSNMIAHSLRHYEDQVADLGRFSERLWQLRRRLLEARHSRPFFDLDGLAKSQARNAHIMWEIHAAARTPMHILVAR